MKRIISFGLLLALLLGCQPTPTEEVVLNKTEGRLESAISEATPVPAYVPQEDEVQTNVPGQGTEPAQNTLRAALGAPEHCTDSVENKVYGGTLSVTIAAEVEVPDVSTVPVFLTRGRTFTPEERERITKLLLGDGPYYEYNIELKQKRSGKRTIEQTAKKLEDLNNRIYGEDFDYEGHRYAVEYNLNRYLENYASLPEPGPMQPWTGSFSDERVKVSDADNRYLSITDGAIYFRDEDGNDAHPLHGHKPATADEKEAAAAAEALFQQLTGDPFAAVNIMPLTDGVDRDLLLERYHLSPEQFPVEEYLVSMARAAAGIPSYRYSTYHGSDTALQAAGVSSDFDEPVLPEYAEALVRDGKVVALNWYNAIEITGTENENVALLPFDEVLDVFKKQIFRSIYLDNAENGKPESRDCMVITRICLSYMKVKKKDAPNERYLLPVWDFMGYNYNPDFPHSDADLIGRKSWFTYQSLLTINAIDGSVIDRDAGY